MSVPKIQSFRTTADGVVIELVVPEDLDEFRGHFPGLPILPGVLQIDWVAQLAARHLMLAKPIARDFQVKFRNIIQPGAALTLALRLDRPKARLHFEYRTGERIMSSGRIALEATA